MEEKKERTPLDRIKSRSCDYINESFGPVNSAAIKTERATSQLETLHEIDHKDICSSFNSSPTFRRKEVKAAIVIDNIDPEEKENVVNYLESQLPHFNKLKSYKASRNGLQAVSSMKFIDRVSSGLNLHKRVSFATTDDEN